MTYECKTQHRSVQARPGRQGIDHILVFSIHQAIADDWSLGVFVQDLCTACVMGLSGFRKAVALGVIGLSNTLPPVPQTYGELDQVSNSTPAAAH